MEAGKSADCPHVVQATFYWPRPRGEPSGSSRSRSSSPSYPAQPKTTCHRYYGASCIDALPELIEEEEEEEEGREGKVLRYCLLGDGIECRTSHLAARMIWRKVFGKTTILGMWWFGVVWTSRSSFLSEASISPSARSPLHPFIKIILVLNL